MNKIAGKKALVLGGIKGIGKKIAIALAKQKVKVAINYYDWEESLDALKKDINQVSNQHLILKTDLRKTENIPALIKKVISNFGGLDILINNIERGGWPIVHGDYTQNQWDMEFETTVRAKQWIFKEALPHLKASGDGAVINFSSIAGIIGRTGPASLIFNDGYAAANRGISILTETWAKLGAPEVKVNEIMLGFFETRHGEKTRGWELLTEKQKQDIKEHTLLKRYGKIKDIVKTVLFFIKDAPFITGSIIKLDGGYTIGGEKIYPMPTSQYNI
ncbi:MAG: SDR family oxidoreductase [Deltaproteobacteria bacterium]|nr:SDR family oxidoreductase [Deltaproteobacteria bacterium]